VTLFRPTALGILFIFGFWISYHYAWQFTFFEPIDDGLIMGPAWRIANGQIPFRDFSTIQGLTAALMEAPFLAVFGPTVMASVIHVSFANGLSGVFSYALLRLAGLGHVASFLFALLTTIIFYPPQGLSFSVQHGALALLIAMIAAFYSEFHAQTPTRKIAAWVLVGVALAMAYLGKQTLGLMVPGIIVLLITGRGSHLTSKIVGIAVGGLFPFIILFVLAGANHDVLSRMWHFLVVMPWQVGGGRLDGDLNEALVVYELAPTPTIVLTFGFLFVCLYAYAKLGAASQPKDAVSRRRALLTVIVGALLMFGNVFIERIHSWTTNGLLQLTFVASGLVCAGTVRLFCESERGHPTTMDDVKKLTCQMFLFLFIFVGAYDAWWMHINLNKSKGMRDHSVFGVRLNIEKTELYHEIKGVKFREYIRRLVSDKIIDREQVLATITRDRRLIKQLRGLPYEVFLRGVPKHALIFAGKVPALPVVTVQPGISSPLHDSTAFELLLSDIERNVQHFNVGGIVVPGDYYAQLSSQEVVRSDIICRIMPIEEFVLMELCPYSELPPNYGGFIAHIVNLD